MPVLSKEFLDIHPIKECRFTLNVYKTQSIYHKNKYSHHRSIIWTVWLNRWVFDYEVSGCSFEFCCSHLNFRYHTCFEQGVPCHSHSSIIWTIWQIDWVFTTKQSNCAFEFRCSHANWRWYSSKNKRFETEIIESLIYFFRKLIMLYDK